MRNALRGSPVSKLYRHLLGYPALRNAQWFIKTVPRQFARLSGAGVACPACQAPATHSSDYPSRVPPFASCSVLYCTVCGLGFVPNMRETLAAYYEKEYALTNRQDRNIPTDAYFAQFEANGEDIALDKYVQRGARQIELLKTSKAKLNKILDYGSGPGYFLWLTQAKEAHAVEPDTLSHKYLHSLGAQIHTDHRALPQSTFDTIVASHAIEHLPSEDLHEVLTALLGALRFGGRLLIEVPQGGHSYLHLAGERQDPHTLFFTGEALVKAVKRAGGRIVFQKALSPVESPRRSDAIYDPKGPPFFRTNRGSLTVICTKPS